jgi:hypothetical protein
MATAVESEVFPTPPFPVKNKYLVGFDNIFKFKNLSF